MEKQNSPKQSLPQPPLQVSVIIVSYNSLDFIERCLTPFLDDSERWFEVIVYDNHGQDGVAELLLTKYPAVKYVLADKNVGFGTGNNRAIELARGEHLLLLNPDAFISDASIVRRLVSAISPSRTAAVAPRLVNIDGSHQVGDAGWAGSITSIIGHAWLLSKIFSKFPSLYLTNDRLLNESCVNVDWLCAACMLVKRRAWEEVGGFDERIFMYGEDVDWGVRARSLGWKMTYLPNIAVTHLQGATQKGSSVFYSTKWIDALYYGLRKEHSRFYVFIAGAALSSGFAVQGLVAKLCTMVTKDKSGKLNRSALKLHYSLHVIKRFLPSIFS